MEHSSPLSMGGGGDTHIFKDMLCDARKTPFSAHSLPKGPGPVKLCSVTQRPHLFGVSEQKLQICHPKPHILEFFMNNDKSFYFLIFSNQVHAITEITFEG